MTALEALPKLLQAAADRKLEFLLIGGHAVAHHLYPRTTEDVDFLIPQDTKTRWLEFVIGAGLKLWHDGGNFLQLGPEHPEGWRLDLMLVQRTTYDRMREAAVSGTMVGMPVKIPSLEHLMALKLHALKHARGIRNLKDMDDLVNLVANNRVEISSESFRSLVLKYGTEDIYAKIQQAFSTGQ